VRGGAHTGGGIGMCDDGLVIDLSLMKGTLVDPVARTVRRVSKTHIRADGAPRLAPGSSKPMMRMASLDSSSSSDRHVLRWSYA
jgi:hypothetical protein